MCNKDKESLLWWELNTNMFEILKLSIDSHVNFEYVYRVLKG